MSAALALLSAALDMNGWICIRALKSGKPPMQSFYAPGDYTGAVAEALRLSQLGYDTYFATSTFNNKASGKAENVNAVKVFKLDLDVGKDDPKKYPTKRDAVESLADFCGLHNLPAPALVDSGGGVHVYWIMDEAIVPDDGKLYSEKLKSLIVASGMKSDPTATADIARILRVPETLNYKKVVARPVTLKSPVHVYGTDYLCDLIDTAYEASDMPQLNYKSPDLLAGLVLPDHLKGTELDATTKGLLAGKPKSFRILLKRSLEGEKGCNQIKYANDHQASVDEPRWRSALSVAWHCEDGAEAIHWISRGHSGYNPMETEKKAMLTVGPHTCAHFKSNWPAECAGCKHMGKITSPIQLGEFVPKAEKGDNVVLAQNKSIDAAPVAYTIPEYPFPYFRSTRGGVWMKDNDDEDNAIEVTPMDFYMVERLRDEADGYLSQMRLHHPKDGVVDFLITTESMGSNADFGKVLNKEGMLVFDKGVHAVRSYVKRWFDHLAQVNEVSRVKTQFGWADDFQSFVVGDKEITAGGVKYSPAAPSLAPLVAACGKKGDLAEWRKVFNVYAMPGFEAHAFCALVGFGAPLMALTNQDGVVINAYSKESGSGKSTTLLAACSVWGDPEGLWISEDDTAQSRYHRMGVYQNLPICVDEVTNMKEEDMSRFLFVVTRGKGRNRMSSSANQERTNNTSWKSIVLCSANTNFTQKMQADKDGVHGELMRLLEPKVPETGLLTKDQADSIFGKLNEHYGHAGEVFIQHVMRNMPRVKDELAAELKLMNAEIGMVGRERFWAAAGACIIVGGRLAQESGLHDIDMEAIRDYFYDLVEKTRLVMQYTINKDGKSDLLGEFLNRHSGSILTVNVDTSLTPNITTELITPKTAHLIARYEKNLNTLYVSASEFNKFMSYMNADLQTFLEHARQKGMLKAEGVMKRLNKGTMLPSVNIRVYVFELTDDMAQATGIAE